MKEGSKTALLTSPCMNHKISPFISVWVG